MGVVLLAPLAAPLNPWHDGAQEQTDLSASTSGSPHADANHLALPQCRSTNLEQRTIGDPLAWLFEQLGT